MTESTLVLFAAIAAIFMVVLLRAGVGPASRAALRTTMVVSVGWILAWNRYGMPSWDRLPMHVWGMLFISLLAVAFAWWARWRVKPTNSAALADRANIGFAALFGACLLAGNFSAQAAIMAVYLVAGAVFLALGSR